jgi:hypothetical protein
MQTVDSDVAMSPFLNNRRINEFKYFANTVQYSTLMYLQADFSIACALIDGCRPPIATSKPHDVGIGK